MVCRAGSRGQELVEGTAKKENAHGWNEHGKQWWRLSCVSTLCFVASTLYLSPQATSIFCSLVGTFRSAPESRRGYDCIVHDISGLLVLVLAE